MTTTATIGTLVWSSNPLVNEALRVCREARVAVEQALLLQTIWHQEKDGYLPKREPARTNAIARADRAEEQYKAASQLSDRLTEQLRELYAQLADEAPERITDIENAVWPRHASIAHTGPDPAQGR